MVSEFDDDIGRMAVNSWGREWVRSFAFRVLEDLGFVAMDVKVSPLSAVKDGCFDVHVWLPRIDGSDAYMELALTFEVDTGVWKTVRECCELIRLKLGSWFCEFDKPLPPS